MKKIIGLVSAVIILCLLVLLFISMQDKGITETSLIAPMATSSLPIVKDINVTTVPVTVATSSVSKKVTESPVLEKKVVTPVKDIYRNVDASYSIEIPKNWKGKVVETGDSTFVTSIVDTTGNVNDTTFVFEITATPNKLQFDAYTEALKRVPTSEDIFNMFIASQEDSIDSWTLVDRASVVINGLSGYKFSYTYGNGEAVAKAYLLFGSKYIYYIHMDARASEIDSLYPNYAKYPLTFSEIK